MNGSEMVCFAPKMIHALFHNRSETLGLIETALNELDLAFCEHHLYSGDMVPSAQDVSGLIVMGGPMNVDETDRYPFLKKEVDLIRDALCLGKPVLGICLGAQLMAKALGEQVFASSKKEVGWRPIQLTEQAAQDPVFASIPQNSRVLHWHGDTFRLPPGAVHLAKTAVCANQAFRWKQNTYALQFHLEATPEMATAWSEAESERTFIAAAGEDPAALKQATPAAFAALRPIASSFFINYLKTAYPVRAVV
jgi:GMP synthase (glutamine-hydrolysing)